MERTLLAAVLIAVAAVVGCSGSGARYTQKASRACLARINTASRLATPPGNAVALELGNRVHVEVYWFASSREARDYSRNGFPFGFARTKGNVVMWWVSPASQTWPGPTHRQVERVERCLA